MSASLRGALWMSGTVLSFCAMAVAARELLKHLGTFEILFFRTGVSLLIVLAIALKIGIATLKTQRIGLHLGDQREGFPDFTRIVDRQHPDFDAQASRRRVDGGLEFLGIG